MPKPINKWDLKKQKQKQLHILPPNPVMGITLSTSDFTARNVYFSPQVVEMMKNLRTTKQSRKIYNPASYLMVSK